MYNMHTTLNIFIDENYLYNGETNFLCVCWWDFLLFCFPIIDSACCEFTSYVQLRCFLQQKKMTGFSDSDATVVTHISLYSILSSATSFRP